jgi:hypothetical protein
LKVIKGGNQKVHAYIFDPLFKKLYAEEEASFNWYSHTDAVVEGIRLARFVSVQGGSSVDWLL